MSHFERIAEKVGMLLDAEIVLEAGECAIKKKRILPINTKTSYLKLSFDLHISFEQLKENGCALNKAEIFLLPEEISTFTFTLAQYPTPLPTNYRQWTDIYPNLICLRIETKEPPENFAARLSATLITTERSKEQYLSS